MSDVIVLIPRDTAKTSSRIAVASPHFALLRYVAIMARAHQGERMRRIGVLMPFAEDNPVGQARLAASLEAGPTAATFASTGRWSADDANLRARTGRAQALRPL
jgi:hypothetical protein